MRAKGVFRQLLVCLLVAWAAGCVMLRNDVRVAGTVHEARSPDLLAGLFVEGTVHEVVRSDAAVPLSGATVEVTALDSNGNRLHCKPIRGRTWKDGSFNLATPCGLTNDPAGLGIRISRPGYRTIVRKIADLDDLPIDETGRRMVAIDAILVRKGSR